MSRPLLFSRLFVLSSLGLGLALMAILAFGSLAEKPLSSEVRSRGKASQNAEGGGMPQASDQAGNAGAAAQGPSPEFTLTDEYAGEVSELMQKLQANPNDGDTLTTLGETFLKAREWTRAEIFLNKAILSKPADIRPRYALGIAQYQQGRLPDAIKTFEELLNVKKDPATLYNLAIIYKYQMGNLKRAEELLREAASSPDADKEIQEKAQAELH